MSKGAEVTTIDVDSIKLRKGDVVDTARCVFRAGRTKDVQFRKKQLKNLLKMCKEHEEGMLEALDKDFRMARQEAMTFEVEFIKNDVLNLIYNIDKWTKPKSRYKRLMNFFDDLKIYKDPYGLVLIYGNWNYPLHTTILPLAGAIAAGNCVILKPSTKPQHSHEFLTKQLPNYLDSDCYHVVRDDTEMKTLLDHKYDYIFYNGCADEAKYLHRLAAQSLTPTTFVINGKNPVYLDETADLEVATRRILWGKCVNAGQASIAPEYLLCKREVQAGFIACVRKIIQEWYGNDPKHSPHFPRLLTQDLYDHATHLLKDKQIAYGGFTDPTTRFVHPTIITDVSILDTIIHEPTNAPILPIITIKSLDEAITFINSRSKPLCLYIFSKNCKDVERMLKETSSGGATVNDTIMHAATESLPIGGVGASGMGSYHGKASFDTFTHEKSVLKKPLNALVEKVESVRYPPYSESKLKMIAQMMRKRRPMSLAFVPYLIAFVLGVVVAVIAYNV